ncbi:Fur family transcriptional regulator [Anaeromicropila herbilytica]|uniref:Transcriptional repressor n=1 Tax=Anaeromicropila herbilytica TaxID=2785025 RepID=A0A7R7ICH0_9FIRM|nr:transcriptional repressor [Anaeromicropila herbilytica]BCN28943.1 transcriptional repressor [Anaeromicropila herbilytica]
MANLKFSRQRESIKEYLAGTTEHPTADTVYMHLREVYPNISLGTVYRNLSLLSNTGEVLKISCGDGSDRFDGNPNPHNHFICKQCNHVYDLEMDSIEHITKIANENFTGEVEGHITYFYGTCGSCLEKNK